MFTIQQELLDGATSITSTSSSIEALKRLKSLGVRSLNERKTPKSWVRGQSYTYLDCRGKQVLLKVA